MVWPFRRKDTAPASRKSSTFFFALGSGKAGLTGADYDRLSVEGYAGCVVAYACISRVASSVASVDPVLLRKNKKTGKLDRVEAHALLDLIESPNPTQSGREFTRSLVGYHQLCGNAYVYGNGIDPNRRTGKPPTELQLLNPGKVKVVPGDGLFPKRFDYRPNQTTTTEFPVDRITGRSAVLQLKTFNPLNAWYGLSPLEAAALGVDIHTGGLQWNKRLIENGARPSGALVVTTADGKPGTLSEDQFSRLKAEMDEQFSGPTNAGRPIILEGGLDWREMSLNPKDMEFLEGKHSAARDIALAYGVPPQLIGIPGDSTFANYEQAMLSFWTDTALPLLGQVYDGFNRWLTPLFGEDLLLWYDEEMIPALEPRRKQKADRVNTASYMTINEKRRAMGLDDVEGGDVIFVPTTSVPLELAGVVDLPPEPGSPADTPPVEDDPNQDD